MWAVALERRATRLKAHYCHTVVMNTITCCSTHQTGSNQLGKMISLVFLLQTASLDICKINNYTCSSRECIWSQTYITYKSILDALRTSTAILINGYSNYLKAHTVLLDSPLHKHCNEKLIQLIFVRVDAIFNFTQMSLRMWGIVLVFKGLRLHAIFKDHKLSFCLLKVFFLYRCFISRTTAMLLNF